MVPVATPDPVTPPSQTAENVPVIEMAVWLVISH